MRVSSLLVSLLLGACAGSPHPWSLDQPAEPGALEPAGTSARGELRWIIAAFEDGRLEDARNRITSLTERAGDDVNVGIWRQEIELAWLRSAETSGTDTEPAGDLPRRELRDRYRAEAEANPGPLGWILAARIEDDDHAARLLLERALELNSDLAWAHYGLAHVAAREGEIEDALKELHVTFELDPDHLPALRLYGWCAAQAGDGDTAVAALEAWLEHSRRDLLATSSIRATVILDLALIHLAGDRPERAEELLDSLPAEEVDGIRRLTAMAAAEQARGRPRASLEVVERALESDPDALLPAVQKALLLELFLGDIEAARAAWRRVLELSANEASLAAGLQRFRAQLHLARLPRKGEGDPP